MVVAVIVPLWASYLIKIYSWRLILAEDDPEPQSRGHLLPSEAGQIAHASHAKRLILTHIPLPDGGEWAMQEATAAYEGPLEIAEPLRTYTV